MTRPATLLLLLVVCACSGSGPVGGGGGGGGTASGGGSGGGGGTSAFSVTVVDSASSRASDLALVMSSTAERAGLAYFTDLADGGQAVKYVEWNDGTLSTAERVDEVHNVIGVDIDFHPTTGEPAIAYLGGGSDTSLLWGSSDAVYSTRASGAWTVHSVATMSSDVDCGNVVSNTGFVVGLYPALRYDSSGTAWLCYRDVHGGQNPTDYTGADIECWHGTTGECALAGGSTKPSAGAHLRMVLVNDQPVVAFDHMGTATGGGTNIAVISRSGSTWSAPVAALTEGGPGPGLAFDATEGVGVVGLQSGVLNYANRASTIFSSADPVFGTGTGGLVPDVAIDSVTHAPIVAFGVCSASPGATTCDAKELRLATRAASWVQQSVVSELPATLRVGILPSGRRMIAYRDSTSGALKVAVSR